MPILFYSKSADYFWLSNFSPHGFELDGKHWPTVEHYFQAAKFFGTDDAWAEQIRQAATPPKPSRWAAAANTRSAATGSKSKDDVMRTAVRRKFETHAELREQLLATGDEELVEDSPNDYYWGRGRSGTGKNMLGRILMEVREALRG